MKEFTITGYLFEELPAKIQERLISAEQESLSELWSANDWILPEERDTLSELGFIDPEFQYSGFYSQGDGLSFTVKSCNIPARFLTAVRFAAVRDYIQNECSFSIKRNHGHYSHENTVYCDIDCYLSGYPRINSYLYSLIPELESAIIQEARGEMRRIYKRLEEDYEADTSEQAARESLTAAGDYYDAAGRRL